MTAPPDLLDSVLAAFPDELHLTDGPYGFTLVFIGAGLRGSAFGEQRADVERFARMYERMRQDMRNGPQRCACGENYARHAWDERSASKRGACPERPGQYEAEGASDA